MRILRDPAEKVASGDRVGIEVELEARTPVDDPIVGLSLKSDGGQRSMDVNTHSDGLSLGRVEGRRLVTLWIDRLDVEPGTYRFDVGVYEASWSYVYDYHWAAYPLEITVSRQGGFGPPHQWSTD